MQSQLFELKNEIIADIKSIKHGVIAALISVTIAQAALIVCALIFF